MKQTGFLTTACIGALAFITASITHEVLGHGGMALVSGGKITLISSVYFHALNTGPATDAAGPIANLILGGVLLLCLRYGTIRTTNWFLFIGTSMSLCLFWGSAYFVYSGLLQKGDWAFLLQNENATTSGLWRLSLILIGFFGYKFSITATTRALLPFAETTANQNSSHPLFRLSVLLYLSAGLTCCLAALPYQGPLGPALHDSTIESFGAFLGLLFVAGWRPKTDGPVEGKGTFTARDDWRWISVAAVCLIVYVAVLGRGYFPRLN